MHDVSVRRDGPGLQQSGRRVGRHADAAGGTRDRRLKRLVAHGAVGKHQAADDERGGGKVDSGQHGFGVRVSVEHTAEDQGGLVKRLS